MLDVDYDGSIVSSALREVANQEETEDEDTFEEIAAR